MNEKINERVSVILKYDHRQGSVMPLSLYWNGRVYKLVKLGYHQKVKRGSLLLHYFWMVANTTCFKLRLETDNLTWMLEEVDDGTAD